MAATKQTTKYGRVWQNLSDVEIELVCFRDHHLLNGATGLARDEHLWNIVSVFWPSNSQRPVDRNPWLERAFKALCEHQYLAISGASGSGKTLACALYALVCWLSDPIGHSIMVSSTTLKESRRRIWGSIEDHWHALPEEVREIGKLTSYDGVLRCNPKHIQASNISSIQLIPGEKRREKEATGKIRGTHNKNVILILDELTELSPAMVEAGRTNLRQNPRSQVIGVGNPSSIFDAHGQFSKPKGGWDTVSVLDEEWETEIGGYHIRFDARKSPNVVSGRTLYPYLPSAEDLQKAALDLGENSTGFWQMWIGFWPPEGETSFVYSPAEIVHYHADKTEVKWAYPPKILSALDPGFTSGGDRSVAFFAEFGDEFESRKKVLRFVGWHLVTDDATDKKTPRNFQIVRRWKEMCVQRGVDPRNAVYDRTGGAAFGDIVAVEWSPEVLGVVFSGKASSRPTGVDRTTADDKYANRVTELWYSLRDFMRSGQIRGVDDSFAAELTSRKYLDLKTGHGAGVQIEPKHQMKARTGQSPDIADAGVLLLELARQRLKFRTGGSKAHQSPEGGGRESVFVDPALMLSIGLEQHGKNGVRLSKSRAASVAKRQMKHVRPRILVRGNRRTQNFR